MRIAFLLPNYSGCVVGSLLVYYNYAAHLALQGHQVDVYHPLLTDDRRGLRNRIRVLLAVLLKNSTRSPVRWMDFPPGVRLRFRALLQGLVLPHDLVVAFSWRAVESLARIQTRGSVFGYIVEYEAWAEAEPALRARMEASYRRGVPLLASSKAVQEMLLQVGAGDVRLSIHGVDSDRRRGGEPVAPRDRDPKRVGFPVRVEPVKSPEVLAQAVRILKERHGQGIVVWGFGSPHVPESLRSLFDEFHTHPSHEELARLYERSSIFAVPSRKEGFGMPAAEAMAHACAVVSTDNGGVHTFGVHGSNCLIVPANDPRSLADAVSTLLDDPEARIALADRAPESVAFLDWSQAFRRFEEQLGL